VRLFLPKLTSVDFARGYRRFSFMFTHCSEKVRCLIDEQCEDAVKVRALAAVPAVMDIVYEYVGFGSPMPDIRPTIEQIVPY